MAFFKSIKNALSKTRSAFSQGLQFLGLKTVIDEETLEELESLLLRADFGLATTEAILKRLKIRVDETHCEVKTALKDELQSILQNSQIPFSLDTIHQPRVILFVGVNGAGKTTSIGKLAHFLKQQNKSVILAAGDTFRAAAVSQLQVWAERNKTHMIAQATGSDSASVIFDAIQSAQAKQIDIVLADTAGRLQNKTHLMDELRKVARVIKKIDASAPHEVILVLDASIGQNALQQLREFHAALHITGLIITKLDGTAKAGIVFALAQEFNLPIYFIGTGENLEDLAQFDTLSFIDSLFEEK
jgi:fused signal recognition particle receptor